MWVWIAIGIGSFLLLSVIVGLLLARILATIAAEITELQDMDEWATLPPARAQRHQAAPKDEAEEPRVPAPQIRRDDSTSDHSLMV